MSFFDYMDYEREMRERQLAHERDLRDNNNPAGRKRPVMDGPDGRKTPSPWIAGAGTSLGQWSYVDSDRARQAVRDKLCIVCGKKLGDNWVYALFNGRPSDHIGDSIFTPPSATYGHPNCILQAVLYCPHLKSQEYPAMRQDKSAYISIERLKELAKQDRKTLKAEGDSAANGVANYKTDRRVRITHR